MQFGAFLVGIAFVSPQPRPVSPTVVENFMSFGLLLGCVFGCALYFHLGLAPTDLSPTAGAIRGITSIDVMRNVLGFVLVAAIRAVLKPVFTVFFHTLLLANGGVKVIQGERDDDDKPEKSSQSKSVNGGGGVEAIAWKDEDIAMGGTALMASTVEGRTLFAQMFTKFSVYVVVAVFIQAGGPYVFEMVGV
jgi:hypothetical protein